jgi:Protein of unknown function (DUF2510)
MSARSSTAGLVGRAIAAVGAIVMGVSVFQPAFEESSVSIWDAYSRLDLVVLGAAAATLVLLLVSLFAGTELLLFVVGVIASFVLGFFLLIYLEFPGSGLGWYLAMAGSSAILAGAAIALVPALVARAGEPADLAFLPAEPVPGPAAHPAGWYADPSGNARLRYWDGQAWTERTQ